MEESSLILFFGIGIVALITFQYATGLHRFNGTMLMTRIYYRAAMSVFLSFFIVQFLPWRTTDLGKILLMGALLSIPLFCYYKRSLNRQIQGTSIIYTRSPHTQFLKAEAAGWLGAAIMMVVAIELPWALAAYCLGWVLSEVYALFYVEKLENKLGAPIMEERREIKSDH